MSSNFVAQFPRQPLTAKMIVEKEAEIAQWRAEINDINKKQFKKASKELEKQKQKLVDVQAGKKEGKVANVEKRIKEIEFTLNNGLPYQIKELEKKIQGFQEMIDTNDEAAIKYQAALDADRAQRDAKKNTVAFSLFGRKNPNAPKPTIKKTIVRKPLAQQPDLINRPLRPESASKKVTTEKVKTGAGVKKNTTTSKDVEKKTVAKDASKQKAEQKPVAQAEMQEQVVEKAADTKTEGTDCTNLNHTDSASEADEIKSSPPVSEAPAKKTAATSPTASSSANENKRKLNDLFTDDEQSPAKKKARSNPQAKSPKKKTRSASARSKQIRRASPAVGSMAQNAEDAPGGAVDEDVEMSDVDEVDAADAAVSSSVLDKTPASEVIQPAVADASTSSKAKDETSTGEVVPPTTTVDSASKKRKATGSPSDGENSRPAKKIQPSPEEAGPKAGEASTASKTAAEASSNGEVANEQDPAEQPTGKVTCFIKGRKNKTYNWDSNCDAGQDWIKGQGKPKHIIDAPTPNPGNTTDDANELRGLTNSQNACFADAAIQLLNSALSDDQVAALRGDGELSLFGKAYKLLVVPKQSTVPGKGPVDVDELRSNISIIAAMEGNIDIGPYLGQVLLDMRNGAAHKSKKGEGDLLVTPTFFQQVFAYGCGKVEQRLRFNGSTQEDTQEYLMAVIDALVGEGHAFMGELFKIGKTTTKKCTACADESVVEESDSAISVMPGSGEDKPKLAELLEGRLSETTQPEGCKCDNCGAIDAHETISVISKLPEHLLVHVERANSKDFAAETKKVDTPVEWLPEGAQFRFDEDEYEVAAVIRHRGRNPTSGHYDAFLKRGNSWHHIDDDSVVLEIKTEQMADGSKSGQCAVLLLRKLLQ